MYRKNPSDGLNLHYLQLFYHVVVKRGESSAAKSLDIDQGTISKQICDLEEGLDVKLFRRRPFELTEKGRLLFSAVQPFFLALPKLEQRLRGENLIRIGAPHVVLRYHLPAVVKQVRTKYPKLQLELRESNQPQLLEMLDRGDVDLVITLLPGAVPQKVHSQPLLQIPLVLLVLKKSGYASAEQIWKQPDAARERLISLVPDELVCRVFQDTLKQKGIEWRPEIQVGSLSLIELFVNDGHGIGLSLQLPGVKLSRKLRAIALPDFSTVPLGMLWRDDQDKLLRAFRQEAEARAELIRTGKA